MSGSETPVGRDRKSAGLPAGQVVGYHRRSAVLLLLLGFFLLRDRFADRDVIVRFIDLVAVFQFPGKPFCFLVELLRIGVAVVLEGRTPVTPW